MILSGYSPTSKHSTEKGHTMTKAEKVLMQKVVERLRKIEPRSAAMYQKSKDDNWNNYDRTDALLIDASIWLSLGDLEKILR